MYFSIADLGAFVGAANLTAAHYIVRDKAVQVSFLDEALMRASVSDLNRQQFDVRVHFEPDMSRARFSTSCTCQGQQPCHHVAAALLQALVDLGGYPTPVGIVQTDGMPGHEVHTDGTDAVVVTRNELGIARHLVDEAQSDISYVLSAGWEFPRRLWVAASIGDQEFGQVDETCGDDDRILMSTPIFNLSRLDAAIFDFLGLSICDLDPQRPLPLYGEGAIECFRSLVATGRARWGAGGPVLFAGVDRLGRFDWVEAGKLLTASPSAVGPIRARS